ncbi:hypothetical protein OG709_28300 [Streptomyces sp. NBC_01267]|uniref:hypothetical protein n=1 Tax=Streptomyces sp. NBC_01267 TaxID=2903805 RepID=UPI002E347D6A|nr:hypothetical protein [Streptomyces sp. NBC_01267]
MPPTLTLTKSHGSYVLEGTAGDASLETGKSMRRGEITVSGRTLPVEVNNPRRTGITVGGSSPVLRLDHQDSFLPGSGKAVQWELSRSFRGYRAAVVSGGDRIDLWLPKFHGKSVEVKVDGDWDQLELVALSACFAVLSRRRGDAFRAMAVAGATGHGH